MKELQSVVLTGLGAITARGDFTLRREYAQVRAHTGETHIIEDFALENYLDSQKTYLDRCSALALAGGALALRDAEIAWPVVEDKFGITLGMHFGCLETMKGFWDNAVQKGTRLANPILFSHSYLNTPISLCAIEFGLKGYHTTLCAVENSGLEAVRAAFDAIRLGHAEAMLCGGVEAVTPTRKLCQNEENLGEASVFFVLESAPFAAKRGAQSTPVFDETLLSQAQHETSNTRALWGDCGGAQSTLALLQHIVNA